MVKQWDQDFNTEPVEFLVSEHFDARPSEASAAALGVGAGREGRGGGWRGGGSR